MNYDKSPFPWWWHVIVYAAISIVVGCFVFGFVMAIVTIVELST